MFIKGEHLFLRVVEPSDLETLYTCENDLSVWKVSNTQTPFSKDVLLRYLETAHQDIYTNKQLRFMICLTSTNESIGTIDLFEFEPAHGRVGVGVLIFEQFRNKGFAVEALQLLKQYVFEILMVNQLYCNISCTNLNSIKLFEKCGFEKAGIKKQWNKISVNTFEDEWMYQLMNH